MGSSFVGIGDQGFWMRDGDLELWLRLAALNLPGMEDMALRDHWLLQSGVGFNGCIDADFDRIGTQGPLHQTVVASLERLLSLLQGSSKPLEPDTLNLLGITGIVFGGPIARSELITTTQWMLHLLAGRITTTPADSFFVPLHCQPRRAHRQIANPDPKVGP